MLTYVAGVSFRPGAREHFPKLLDGEALQLVPEPQNPHDRSAVAVYDGAMHLGYVPRADAPAVSQAMAKSRAVSARLNRTMGTFGLEVNWD